MVENSPGHLTKLKNQKIYYNCFKSKINEYMYRHYAFEEMR